MRAVVALGPFLGIVSTHDPRNQDPKYAQRSLNNRHEEADIKLRYGYNNIYPTHRWKGDDCEAVKLFEYFSGIIANQAFDEYLSMERFASGTLAHLFGINPDDGRRRLYTKPGSVNEVQDIDLGGATGGTWTFTLYGETTVAMAYNITASTLETYLESFYCIEPGDVTVTIVAGKYRLTWGGQYAGENVALGTIDTTSLTGGGATSITTVTPGSGGAYLPDFADAYWRGFPWDSYYYLINYAAGDEASPPYSNSSPIVRITPGDYDSIEEVKPPSAPTGNANKSTVKYRKQIGSDAATYKILNLAALATTDTVDDGTVVNDSASGAGAYANYLQQNIKAAGDASTYFSTALMTAGVQDWTYPDAIAFTLWKETAADVKINPNSVRIYITHDAYTKITGGGGVNNDWTVEPTWTELDVEVGWAIGLTDADLAQFLTVYAKFIPGKVRTDWATMRGIKIAYTVTDTTGTAISTKFVRISPLTIGGMPGLFVEGKDWQIGYQYKNSSTGFSSNVDGIVTLPNELLIGQYFSIGKGSAPIFPMGVYPTLTFKKSNESGVDKIVVCVRQQAAIDSKEWTDWRTIEEIANPGGASVDYIFGTTSDGFPQLNLTNPGDFQFDNIVQARVAHGAVCYLCRGQRLNVRWSAVGDPLRMAAIGQANDDFNTNRYGPANFPLTNDESDEPIDMWPVSGGSLFFGGKCPYFQTGTLPLDMSALRRIGNAPGVAGPNASCPFRDANGSPGVAYLSHDCDALWFARIVGSTGSEYDAVAYDMSIDVRGLIKEHLFEGNTTISRERIIVRSDTKSDSLWIVYANRAVVLRRPNILDNQRGFECYKYVNSATGWTGDSWIRVHFHPDRGIRALEIDGSLDEIEWDTSSGGTSGVMTVVSGLGAPGSVPASDSSAALDIVYFTSSPGWRTGAPVVAGSTVGGFVSGQTYYARRIGAEGAFRFYDTYAHAINRASETGRVNVTADSISIGFTAQGRDAGWNVPMTSDFWYWRSKVFVFEEQRRLRRMRVKRDVVTSGTKILATSERDSREVTMTDNREYIEFPVTLTGHEFWFEVRPQSQDEVIRYIHTEFYSPGNRRYNK